MFLVWRGLWATTWVHSSNDRTIVPPNSMIAAACSCAGRPDRKILGLTAMRARWCRVDVSPSCSSSSLRLRLGTRSLANLPSSWPIRSACARSSWRRLVLVLRALASSSRVSLSSTSSQVTRSAMLTSSVAGSGSDMLPEVLAKVSGAEANDGGAEGTCERAGAGCCDSCDVAESNCDGAEGTCD